MTLPPGCSPSHRGCRARPRRGANSRDRGHAGLATVRGEGTSQRGVLAASSEMDATIGLCRAPDLIALRGRSERRFAHQGRSRPREMGRSSRRRSRFVVLDIGNGRCRHPVEEGGAKDALSTRAIRRSRPLHCDAHSVRRGEIRARRPPSLSRPHGKVPTQEAPRLSALRPRLRRFVPRSPETRRPEAANPTSRRQSRIACRERRRISLGSYPTSELPCKPTLDASAKATR